MSKLKTQTVDEINAEHFKVFTEQDLDNFNKTKIVKLSELKKYLQQKKRKNPIWLIDIEINSFIDEMLRDV